MHIKASAFINDDESGLRRDRAVFLEKLPRRGPAENCARCLACRLHSYSLPSSSGFTSRFKRPPYFLSTHSGLYASDEYPHYALYATGHAASIALQ